MVLARHDTISALERLRARETVAMKRGALRLQAMFRGHRVHVAFRAARLGVVRLQVGGR